MGPIQPARSQSPTEKPRCGRPTHRSVPRKSLKTSKEDAPPNRHTLSKEKASTTPILNSKNVAKLFSVISSCFTNFHLCQPHQLVYHSSLQQLLVAAAELRQPYHGEEQPSRGRTRGHGFCQGLAQGQRHKAAQQLGFKGAVEATPWGPMASKYHVLGSLA